jgi:hypothetical protein
MEIDLVCMYVCMYGQKHVRLYTSWALYRSNSANIALQVCVTCCCPTCDFMYIKNDISGKSGINL